MAEDPEIFVDLANNILAYAGECLEGTILGRPADAFVSHVKPPDDCCDFVSVWYRGIRPTDTQPDRCSDISWTMELSLIWRRPCFPTLHAYPKTNPFPTPAEMQVAAENLLIDARTMQCCITAAYFSGLLTPRPAPADQLRLTVTWGSMTPQRTGDCAGWQWDFEVEVPACCWPAPDLACCGGWSDSFAYPDGVPPNPPWTGVLGADPGQIVSNKLWGADAGPGSFPGRECFCPEASVPPIYHSDVRSIDFMIRGGANGEGVGAGLYDGALAPIVTFAFVAGEWTATFGAITVLSGNANVEGVHIVAAWTSAGAYSVTFDGGSIFAGNAGALSDPALFVAQLILPYDAVDPTTGNWIADVVLGC